MGSIGPIKSYSLDEVTLVNKLFLEGIADFETTYQKFIDIRKLLYSKRIIKEDRPKYSEHNLDILERYWVKMYPLRRQRSMKTPQKAREGLENAISACGDLSIDMCSIEELENRIHEEFKNNNQNVLRRHIMWLNSILTWLGRPKITQTRRKERLVVTYLSELELKELCLSIVELDVRKICQIAFYTGLRQGEIFGLTNKSVKDDRLHVDCQMLRKVDKYRIETTKTSNSRDAIFPLMVKPIIDWFVSLPLEEKKILRSIDYCKIVKKICHKLWPSDSEKDCNFHSLRHSNAIWLLQKGATIHEVAQHLGNHVEVTERYYSGFVLRKESVARLNGLIN